MNDCGILIIIEENIAERDHEGACKNHGGLTR